MVQPEGDECPLDQAEHQCSEIPRMGDEAPQRKYALLYQWPERGQDDAHEDIDSHSDNGNEMGAAEKGQETRQCNFVAAIVDPGDAQANDDTAEDSRLEGQDAATGGKDPCRHIRGGRAVRQDHTLQFQDGVHGDIHRQKGGNSRQGSYLLFLFRHAESHGCGEDQGQVGKNCLTCGIDHCEQGEGRIIFSFRKLQEMFFSSEEFNGTIDMALNLRWKMVCTISIVP